VLADGAAAGEGLQGVGNEIIPKMILKSKSEPVNIDNVITESN
jgi:hypothetical protein